jgi:excisionase family DNA binding protein
METRTYVREPAPAHSPPDPAIARRPVPLAEEDSWLTRTDVAHLFQVSPSTVTRWAREGRIPAKRTPGGHYRYPAPDMRRLAGTAAPGDVVRLD